MILWVMPDAGDKSKDVYASFISLFKKENPSVDVTMRVFTRNVLWRRMFTIKHPTHEEEVPDLIQIPHYWTALLVREGVKRTAPIAVLHRVIAGNVFKLLAQGFAGTQKSVPSGLRRPRHDISGYKSI